MHIQAELDGAETALSQIATSYIDYDGRRRYVPPTDQELRLAQRARMLEELLQLGKPISETEWATDMRFGMCPCTLALQRYHESMEDPMGDMMGRNL